MADGTSGKPPMLDTGERALVERAQRGDVSAFKMLYTLHVPGVYEICLHKVGDETAAAELSVEAFTTAWDRLADIPGDSEFELWIRDLTERLIHSRRRRYRFTSSGDALQTLGELTQSARDSNNTQLRRTLWPFIQGKIETDDVSPLDRQESKQNRRRKRIARWSIFAVFVLAIVFAFLPDVPTSTDVLESGVTNTLETPLAQVNEDPEAVDELQVVQEEYGQAKEELMEFWESQKETTDPELIESVDESMGVVETAIGEILSAMSDDPDNEVLQKMLVSTYRNQLAILRGALHQDE